jgi:hypothetical protein
MLILLSCAVLVAFLALAMAILRVVSSGHISPRLKVAGIHLLPMFDRIARDTFAHTVHIGIPQSHVFREPSIGRFFSGG